ncbi:GNAT family acetyltransferase Nat4 [Aspergillus sclerotialis]|uniref:N-alpha-acetyltransferase 40 n=1 Tax=Aspergillus sclerotialis TaxID=2070753 RepID=A0A3A2ZM52_9EURO|nr:GNAT family acetyltransferase Nat4 [Aspergillus sclerotialis]
MEKYKLDIYTADSIPKSDFESSFRLVELTSSGDYANSGTGWSPTKKKREMKLPDMKYLILRRGSDGEAARDEGESRSTDCAQGRGEVLGFLSFMVTYEDGKEVIYCYEIHLSPAVQGRGLGKHLIKRCEEIGRRIGLEKSMLSVFRSNRRALNMYTTSGYTVDEFSPPPRKLRNGTIKEAEYLIMSKVLKNSGGDERERSGQGQ